MQQSYAEGARLRAAEEAERHRLQLELAEVRPEAEGLEEGRTGGGGAGGGVHRRRRGWRRGAPEAEGVEEGRTASPNPERHPQPCV